VPKRVAPATINSRLGRWYECPLTLNTYTFPCHVFDLTSATVAPHSSLYWFSKRHPASIHISAASRFSASVSRLVSRIALTVCGFLANAISRCSSSVFPAFNQPRLMTTSSSVAPFYRISSLIQLPADVVAQKSQSPYRPSVAYHGGSAA